MPTEYRGSGRVDGAPADFRLTITPGEVADADLTAQRAWVAARTIGDGEQAG